MVIARSTDSNGLAAFASACLATLPDPGCAGTPSLVRGFDQFRAGDQS